MIKFRCPHCQQKLGVPDEYAGRRVRCSKCSQPSIVPKPATSQTPNTDNVTQKSPSTDSPFSQSAIHQTTTAELTSQGSYTSTRNSPERLDDALSAYDNAESEEASRQEAIRQASKNRARATAKQKPGKDAAHSESKTSRRERSDRLSFQELVPDFLRLPLSIVFGFVAAGLAVLVWAICSRAAADALCFMAIFVPVAAALAIRVFVVERRLLIGLMCVVIGGLSIAGGKAVIAKFVVLPYFQASANEEVLTDLESILSDPDLQYPPSESVKPFTRDGDFMTCAALVSLVEEGQADPIKARSWAVHIMLHSNKLSLIDFFDSATGGGSVAEAEPIPNLSPEDEAVFGQVWTKMGRWSDDETELQMARKYYPAVAKITQQAKILDTFEDQELTYQMAFLNTLGLFDLVWILMGLGLGYAVAVFD